MTDFCDRYFKLSASAVGPLALLLGGLVVAGEVSIHLKVEEALREDLTGPPIVFQLRSAAPDSPLSIPVDVTELRDIGKWQIQIVNNRGEKAGYMQGKSAPLSARIAWSGFSTDGAPLPDGFYRARFAWVDTQGKLRASPTAAFSLFTPPELGNLWKPTLRFDYTQEGLVIRIPVDLVFGPGQWEIAPHFLSTLKAVAEWLDLHPRHPLAVVGHTDLTGSAHLNLALSRKRAYEVYRQLIKLGVASDRLTYQGLGSDRPIASNTTQDGRAKNRRVEIVVLRAA